MNGEPTRIPRPWDVLNPNTQYVAQEVAENRYNICTSCDKFNKVLTICTECGCFMKIKTTMAHATCPQHKWK